jgi:hypothetical protein
MKDIYSHAEMSEKEGLSLQRGMNFRPNGKDYSIFLMSVREGSPYNDGFDEKGEKLIYEGEDINRRESDQPKESDQSMFTKTGKLTNNGLFFKAAEDYKNRRRIKPEVIRVYEKLSNNVWSDKGLFHLIDNDYKDSPEERRKVFKFILLPIGLKDVSQQELEEFEFSRRIPTDIKRIVWERDGGKCTYKMPDGKICGVQKNLHFDHIIPWSKGGSSVDPKNIQLLCGKHNLGKSAKII